MPLTYSDITKVITAEYIVGDLKGNSLANAWTVDDFQLAMVAAGHGAKWTQQESQYLIDGVSIKIQGTGTYVHFYRSCIEWTGVITATYLIDVSTTANFQVGYETTSLLSGCMFLMNQTERKYIWLRGYSKIYDSIFASNTTAKYNISFTAISADDPIIFIRNKVHNASYINPAGIPGTNIENVIIDDNYSINSNYFLPVSKEFLSSDRLQAVGSMFDLSSQNGTVRIKGWYAPGGTGNIRAYWTDVQILRKVDCVTGNINVKANYGLSGVGAKAQEDSISTFQFYITNGENADIIVMDVDGNTILTDVLDASGELEVELMYKRRYQEKLTTDPTYENYNKTFTPFSIHISKAGYSTRNITDVEVIEGELTIIRGVLEYPELLISAVIITDCTTIGASDGKLEITAQGGDGSYTYSINGVDYQASDTFSGLSAGDYTVYVKDGEDTVAEFDVRVSEPIPEAYAELVLSADLTEDALTCDLAEEILTCDFIE